MVEEQRIRREGTTGEGEGERERERKGQQSERLCGREATDTMGIARRGTVFSRTDDSWHLR